MATRKKKAAKKTKVTILRKRKRAELRWVTTTQIATSVFVGKHQLALAVSQDPTVGKWTVIALETDADAGLEAVLANHAHKVIGIYNELFEAMLAATTFAQKWKPSHDMCDCEELR